VGGRKPGGRTDAVGNSGAEWEPIILCAQVERLAVRIEIRTTQRASIRTYVRMYVYTCVSAICAYINCIFPLNSASWLTDCALLIRIPIIGDGSGYFYFPVFFSGSFVQRL